ncbi:Major facilitator superfamily MFS-1 [mine drainage metagenome]|uniref:Major facilitator superfamily MFS-1 n=1 Tax=mine drainage metagenome TaxID=410659 RepID=T1A3H8_9ZZZZ
MELILVYASISLFASLITVNWFSLIADQSDSTTRGKFLAVINILSAFGTIISLIIMTFLFKGNVTNDIRIPFFAAAGSYVISGILMGSLDEKKKEKLAPTHLVATIRNLKSHPLFYRYFIATNIQGIFWSMAWPMFPITIVSVMHFTLTNIAFLTVASLGTTLVIQYFLGRITDKVNRPPLIFANRVLLSAIPLLYAFSSSFNEFIILEVYSGILGSIQNVVMNSYLLDVIPHERKAEYLSIINGFNGVIYLTGALIGGYLLELMIAHSPSYLALVYSYLIVFSGRFASSFMFVHLKEPEQKGRSPLSLYSMLYRPKQPGNPSGGTLRFR